MHFGIKKLQIIKIKTMKKNLLLLLFILPMFLVKAQTVILSEKFEDGVLPTGWQNVSSAAIGWNFGKITDLKTPSMSYAGNTSNFATTNEEGKDQKKIADLLVTPKLNLQGKKAIFMSLNVYFGGYTNAAGKKEEAFIQASKDAGKTWTNVAPLQSTKNAKSPIAWKTQLVDLTAYNKDTAVWFAVKYTDNGGWILGIGIDDVKIYEPIAIDAAFKLATYPKYSIKATPVKITGAFTNLGSATITDIDMTYKVGTTTESKKITGLNIAPTEVFDLAHPTDYNYSGTGAFSFDVSIDKINGTPITNTSNFKTLVISKNVQRKVVFEEATGTWCGWCPRGAVFMDSMAKAYPNEFIGIAVHNNDVMQVAVYNSGLTKTPGFGGFPGVVVNRTSVIDPSQMFSVYDDARAELNPFTLSQKITYDSITRKVTVTVKGSAAMTTKGDYRFNVVLSEDAIKGIGSSYAQVNFYAENKNGPMGGFENLPDPVPASEIVYNHVGRAILGTYAGLAGSIPADIEEDKEYSSTFTYTLPNIQKPANMHAVALVLDAKTGQIMTAVTDRLIAKKVGANDVFENNAVNIYPNPMSEYSNIEISTAANVAVSVTVFNNLGQQVAARNYGNMSGENILPFSAGNLPNGVYTILVKMGDKLATKKVVVQK